MQYSRYYNITDPGKSPLPPPSKSSVDFIAEVCGARLFTSWVRHLYVTLVVKNLRFCSALASNRIVDFNQQGLIGYVITERFGVF